MKRIVDMSLVDQRKVIKLYKAAFDIPDIACKPCGGKCCRSCGVTNGYLPGHIPLDEVKKLKEKYNFIPMEKGSFVSPWPKSIGFFVEGKGCSLPVKERSPVCIAFACGLIPHTEAVVQLYRILYEWPKQLN